MERDVGPLPQSSIREAVARKYLVSEPWLSLVVFRQMLKGVPTVETLLVRVQDWGLGVWTIVNNSAEDIRCQVYNKEWELMQRFPGLGVAFELIDREDRPLEQLVTLEDIDSQFTFRGPVHAT